MWNHIRHMPPSMWVGIGIGALVTVFVTLAVALPLYFQGQKERILVYAVNPVRTNIIAAGETSGFSVLYDGQELGDVDITAMQIAVWSTGELPVWHHEVLDPIIIVTEPPVRILKATIRSQPSSNVTQLNIDTSPEFLENGQVPVSWRVLETNDGASLQLVFVGKQDVALSVQGSILGQRSIREIQPESIWSAWPVLGLAIMYILAIALLMYRVVKRQMTFGRTNFAILVFLCLGAIGMFCIFAFVAQAPPGWPPFGF